MQKDFFAQIKDAVYILKFDKTKMLEISGRKSATAWGVVILLLPSVVDLILASLNFPSGFGVIFSRFLLWPMFVPPFAVVGTIFLMSFLAVKAFKGQGNHIGFFRTISYASVVLWLSIIPFLLAFLGVLDPIGFFNLIWIVAMIWMLCVAYQMLIIHHKLKQQDAVIVLIAGVVGYFILRGVLGRILVGKSYRLWY